jgi:hypothetical protein
MVLVHHHPGETAMRTILSTIVCAMLALPAIAIGASINGKYLANGKDASMTHVMAVKGKPYINHPTTVLIFSEKDASAAANPDMDAFFGKLGAALVVTVYQDKDGWSVIGSDFYHPSLKDHRASATGVLKAGDMKVANGEISGRIFSAPGADLFDEPIQVDERFSVKMP